MIKRFLPLFFLSALFALPTPEAWAQSIRINELQPVGAEFIEFYYTGMTGAENLSDYNLTISNPSLIGQPLPSYTLNGSGFVAVYFDSGIDSGTSLYLNLGTGLLDDNGSECTLRRVSDNVAVDYVSYGTAVASPPAPLTFSSSYNTGNGYYAAGDSIAFVGTNADNPVHWINRRGANITPGAVNTTVTPPTVSYDVTSLSGVDSGEAVSLPITIAHTDEAPFVDGSLTFTLPSGFLFDSASNSGTFNQATRTVTWNLSTQGSGSYTRTVVIRPDCSVTSASIPSANTAFIYRGYSGGSNLTLNASNAVATFSIAQPDLVVSISDYAIPANGYILSQQDAIINLLVTVTNSGSGNLVGDGGTVAIDLPSDLSFLTVRVGTPTGPSVSNFTKDLANNDYTWSSGAINAGSSVDFIVRARVLSCGTLSATADLEWTIADTSPGTSTCTVTSPSDLIGIYCTLDMSITYPDQDYTSGEPIPVTILINNSNDEALVAEDFTLSFHNSFYLDSAKIGGSDVGTYNQGLDPKTLTIPSADLGSVPANGSLQIDVVLRASCDTPNDRKLTGTLNYSSATLGNPPQFTIAKQSAGIQVLLPGLVLSVEDPDNPGQTTVRASRGDEVIFLINTVNNGAGDLDQDGPDLDLLPDGAFVEITSIGAGIVVTGIRDVTGIAGPYTASSGTAVTLTTNATTGNDRWNTGSILAGAANAKQFLFVALVDSCEGLDADLEIYSTITGTHPDDVCTEVGDSSGSVDIILETPEISFPSPGATVIDYCSGGTVSTTISNLVGAGPIRNLVIAVSSINTSDFDLDTSGGDFDFVSSYNNPGHPAHGKAAFVLSGGQDTDADGSFDDIAPNDSVLLEYTLNVKTGGVACSPSGASQLYQPYYDDDCDIPWTVGVASGSYSVTSPPGVAFSTDGPAFADVDVSQTTDLTYSVDFDYIGVPNDPFEYTLVLSYPDGFNYVSLVQALNGSSSLTHDTLNRTVTIDFVGTFDGAGAYSANWDFIFYAPIDNCAAGSSYTFTYNLDVTDPASPVDCNDCPQSDSFIGSSITTLNNDDEDAISAQYREVTYLNTDLEDNPITFAGGETCSEIQIDHYLKFNPANAPADWELDFDGPGGDAPQPILFDETFFANYGIPGGAGDGSDATLKSNLQLEVYYFTSAGVPTSPGGSNLVGSVTVDNFTPTAEDYDRVKIDLSNMPDAPDDGGWLWFRYRMEVRDQTPSGGNPPSSEIEFADLEIPRDSALCGGDLKTEYRQAVVLRTVQSDAEVEITNVSSDNSGVVDRCETVTFHLEIDTNTPFDLYDTRLVLNLGNIDADTNRWRYDATDANVSFVGLVDESGTTIGSFDPTTSGTNDSILTWNLGDLRDADLANTYIAVTLHKSCDESSSDLQATIYSNQRCNNDADTALAAKTAPEDFDFSRSDTYSPRLDSGILSTLFTNELIYYNDGYPTIRFDIVNSGNGDLHNVKIPIRLGNASPTPKSLSYVSASVIKRTGTATFFDGSTIDQGDSFIPFVSGTEDDATPVDADGDDAEREVVFFVKKLNSGSLVTVEIRLRMHYCDNLSAEILNTARWGCDGDACGSNIETGKQEIEIRQGNTRVFVLSHTATPSVLDFCGSLARFQIEIVNVGAVDVYEPIIQEQLPPGLTLVEDSAKYYLSTQAGYSTISYDSMNDFPGGATAYTEISGDGSAANPQKILWNFTDPNDDDSESDALLNTASYNDAFPVDPNFVRSKVLKPGQRIKLSFDAVLEATGDCANAVAYYESTRTATATILFDLPCNHDNTLDVSGATLVSPPRSPLEDNTRDSNFLDPGAANLILSLAGKNQTQSPATTYTGQLNGEQTDTLIWTFSMESTGPGVVPNPSLKVAIPDYLTFVSASIAGVDIALDDTAPTPTLVDGKNEYVFTFENLNPFMIEQGRSDYFNASGTVDVIIETTVASCNDTLENIVGTVTWGCCQGIPELADANGQDVASMDLKTVPDAPVIDLREGPTEANDEFTSCGGYFIISIENPSRNRELSLRDMVIDFPLPDGYEQDDSVPTLWTYTKTGGGASSRPGAFELTSGTETEPILSGGSLIWKSSSNGGSIPDTKARIWPQETVKIQVYLRTDGTHCDTDEDADPSIPDFTQGVTFNYTNSCDEAQPAGSDATPVSVLAPNLNISLSPDPTQAFISNTDTQVTWTLILQNVGETAADEIELSLEFGDGYSSIVRATGTPAESSSPGNTFEWNRGTSIGPIAKDGGSVTWTFTATIDTLNRGDLSATALVKGYCLDQSGSDICTYSTDRDTDYVVGGTITKVIDGTELLSPAVSTDPGPNDAAATEADVTIGSIIRYVLTIELLEGGSTDIQINDTLPTGFTFLQANARKDSGVWSNLPRTGSGTNVVLAPSGILNNNVGVGTFEIEVWVQVEDKPDLPSPQIEQNLIGQTKKNVATVSLIKGEGARTFTHNDPIGADLQDDVTVTILEPRISNDEKTAQAYAPRAASGDDFSNPDVLDLRSDPNTIDYFITGENTGTSPAYELELTDAIPSGMTVSSATVSIDRDGGGTDTLVLDTDYTFSFTPGTGGNAGELAINLLSTAKAIFNVGDVIDIEYTASIVSASPGQSLYNLATFSGFSSLPDAGGTVTTQVGSNYDEEDRERTSYGDTFIPANELRTYHEILGDLAHSKAIKNELTLADGAAPADTWRTVSGPDSPDPPNTITRATIGELVSYQVRLSIPPFLSVYNLQFEDTVPDGLTVQSVEWELVDIGDDFSAGKTTFYNTSGPVGTLSESNGTTPIVINPSSDTGPFPDFFSGGTGTGKDVLIEILATVDQALNSGAVISNQSFSNTATFRWAYFTGGSRVENTTTGVVSFTALIPTILDSSVSKSILQYLESDASTAYVPTTRSVFNRFPNAVSFTGLSGNATANNVNIVKPGQYIQYRYRFTNSGTTKAYDVKIEDYVPLSSQPAFIPVGSPYGLDYIATGTLQPAVSATTGTPVFSSGPTFTDNLLKITLDEVAAGATVDVTFWMQVQSDISVDLYFGNRADLTDYRTLPDDGAVVDYPALARTMSPVPSSTAFPPIAYDDVGLATESATYELSFASDLTAPTAGETYVLDNSGRATIGEEVVYRLTVDIPDDLVLWDWRLRNSSPGGNYWQITSGLTVRAATIAFGNGAANTFPGGNISVQSNGTTRISLPGAANLSAEPASYPDIKETEISSPGSEPAITLHVYGTVDEDDLETSFTLVTNGSGASATYVDKGDTLFLQPRVRYVQWNGLSTTNETTLPTRTFQILEPTITAITKTLETAPTNGTGDGFNNFYGEGPLTSTATDPVDSVPLFEDGDTIQYQLVYTNSGNATAYDVVLSDRIPKGLTYTAASAVIASQTNTTTSTGIFSDSTPSLSAAFSGQFSSTLNLVVDQVDPGETITITYDTTVDDPVAPGRYLQNRVDLTDYSTLPESYDGLAAHAGVSETLERDSDSDNPYTDPDPDWAFAGTASDNASSKAVQTELTAPSGFNSDGTSRATIGEMVTYQLKIDIPDNRALYDVFIFDELPDGMTIVPGGIEYSLTVDAASDTANGTGLTAGILTDGNREFGLALGDLIGVAGADEIVVTISAFVDPALDSNGSELLVGDDLSNTFTFSWNQVDEDPSPSVDLSTDARLTVNSITSNTVELTVQEPDLTFTFAHANVSTPGYHATDEDFYLYTEPSGGNPLQVTNVDVALPGETIRHTLTVSNTGDAPAFEIDLEAILPAQDYVTYQNDAAVSYYLVSDDSVVAGYVPANFVESPTTVSLDGLDHDQLKFTLRHLLPGQYATITYTYDLEIPLGAGQYLGPYEPLLTGSLAADDSLRVAELEDYRSLPAASLTVNVGNLASGTTVEDATKARTTDSGISISDPSPYVDQDDYTDLGVMWPTFDKQVFKLFDSEGDLYGTPLEILDGASANDRAVRIGDVMRYTLTTTLPPHTALYDGTDGGGAPDILGLVLREDLPEGFQLRAGSESTNFSASLTGSLNGSRISDHSGTQERWRWRFNDIANTTAGEVDFAFSFDTDVTNLNPSAVVSHHTSVTSVDALENNQAWIFWETNDRGLGKSSLDTSVALTTGDHPSLGDVTTATPRVTQPNLTFSKGAYRYDATGDAPGRFGVALVTNDLIGVTGAVGDSIVYQVVLTNAGTNGSINSSAYDIAIDDNIPVDLRTTPMTPGADLATSNFVAYITDGSDTVQRILDPDTGGGGDYVLTYNSTTGVLAYRAQYNTVDSDYAAQLAIDEKLHLTYVLTLDNGVGARGGGLGQRVNRASTDYRSFPKTYADASLAPSDAVYAKNYDQPDKAFALVLDNPILRKVAIAPLVANESVGAGDIITYRIAAPYGPIRSDMYDAEILDVIPDGMEVLTVDVYGVSSATVATTLTSVGSGTRNRSVFVEISKIENESDTASADDFSDTELDLLTDSPDPADLSFADDGDQAIVVITAEVHDTFDSGNTVPRLHAFQNNASLFWHDAILGDPSRNRYGDVSGIVTHFFNAFGVLFEPSHSETASPGTTKAYRHIIRNFTDVSETVTISWPASTRGWQWAMFLGDGDGNFTGDPIYSGDAASTLTVPANDAVEVIFRAFIPIDEPPNVTDILVVTASSPNFDDIVQSDITIIADQSVEIWKAISKNGQGGTYSTNITVDPDNTEYVWNRLRFLNNSQKPIKEVYVYDFIPEHMSYIANSGTDDGEFQLQYSIDGGASWVTGEPSLAEATSSVSGGKFIVPSVTNLRWYYTGNSGGLGAGKLEPGTEKTVYFQSRID